MDPITFSPHNYLINGQPVYLLSGEFHYFRVPKSDWRTRMKLFKQAGGNCLATYIPWLLHEPSEGDFRFSGEDWLDLEGFLRAAQELGLYVIARPGPYQYSELAYHGLPGWLIDNYPETLALNPQGKPIGYASVSYTHPTFLKKVKAWFDTVCPILARYTIENGGPIAFTQIDNEMIGIHEWFGSLDYHPTTMGFGTPNGAYPAFMRARYGQVERMNAAYGTHFASFADARPVTEGIEGGLASIRARKDYFDFYLSTVADYAQTLVGWLREHGIRTPIVHNSGNPGMNADFAPVIERLGKDFLLGSDHYYSLDQSWPQNNPTPQYAARVFVSLEMLRLMGFPPTVFEIPGGSASNWPPVTPPDALACYLTNLAFGMKGSNYYIFTGGPNPPGAGVTTDLYDYDASIGARGEIRPLYEAQKTFGQIAQRPDIVRGRRVSDLRLGMDLEYARAESYWKPGGEWLVSPADAWNFLRRGPLTTALCASLSPEFVDLSSEDWTGDNATPLVVACAAQMARGTQERLVRFLQNGGRALFAPILPVMDENFEPCTTLSDFLGLGNFEANRRGLSHPRVEAVDNVLGSVYFALQVSPAAEMVGEDTFSQRPFAFFRSFESGGKAVVLGMTWAQAMREHERMFTALLVRLGLKQVVQCANPNLWTSLTRDENTTTLFVLNLFTAPMESEISVEGRSLGTVQVDPVSVKMITL